MSAQASTVQKGLIGADTVGGDERGWASNDDLRQRGELYGLAAHRALAALSRSVPGDTRGSIMAEEREFEDAMLASPGSSSSSPVTKPLTPISSIATREDEISHLWLRLVVLHRIL